MSNGNEMVGRHRAKACSWGYGKTSSGGIQIGIEFDFLDIPGKRMTYYGSFSGNAAEHTFKAMRACGWQGELLTEIDDLGTNEVSVVVDWDEYQGKKTLKVKWVNSAGGLAFKESVEVAELAEFAHNMVGVVKAVSPGTRKAPEPQAFGRGQWPAQGYQAQGSGYGGGGRDHGDDRSQQTGGYGGGYGAPPPNDDLPF